MQRVRLLPGVALALSIALAAQEGADDRLRVNVFPGPQNLALYVAQEKGLFTKRGLAVEIQFTPTSKAQRDALADGRITYLRDFRLRLCRGGERPPDGCAAKKCYDLTSTHAALQSTPMRSEYQMSQSQD